MTVYVGPDFLLALAKDSDWLQGSPEEALGEYDVETSVFSYLELLLAREHDKAEKQVVLKAVNYYDEGMTPFDGSTRRRRRGGEWTYSRRRKTTRTWRYRECR